MLSYCLKNIIRSPLRFAFLLLLLAVVSAFLCFGICLFVSANNAASEINDSFTTIATLNSMQLRRELEYLETESLHQELASSVYYWQDYLTADEIFKNTGLYISVTLAGKSVDFARKDERTAFWGYSDNFKPVISHEFSVGNGSQLNMVFGHFVALVKCVNADFNVPWWLDSYSGVLWEVEEYLCLAQDMRPRDTLICRYYIGDNIEDVEGYMKKTHNIQVGNRYLITGEYGYWNPNLKAMFFRPVGYYSEEECPYMGFVRGVSEITGSLESFLKSEEGEVWEQLTNDLSIVYHSVCVVTTNNLNSVMYFNRGQAEIIDGRTFSKEKYIDGIPVCIVSDRFTKQNKLKMGDCISLELFPMDYSMAKRDEWDLLGSFKPTYWYPSIPKDGLISVQEPKEYEIVGIYRSPTWELHEYTLSPNTVFIPSNSAPAREFAEDEVIPPILYTLIIPNNMREEFEKELETTGFSEYFYIFDQGYESISRLVKSLSFYAAIILTLGAVCWATVMFLFLRLIVFSGRREAKIMLTLGAKRRYVRGYLFMRCLFIVIPALIIALFVSANINETVAKRAYEETAAQINFDYSDFSGDTDSYLDTLYTTLLAENSRSSIIYATAAQFLLITVISFIAANIVAKQKLMTPLGANEE